MVFRMLNPFTVPVVKINTEVCEVRNEEGSGNNFEITII